MSTGKLILLVIGGYIAYEYLIKGNDVFSGLFGSATAAAPVAPSTTTNPVTGVPVTAQPVGFGPGQVVATPVLSIPNAPGAFQTQPRRGYPAPTPSPAIPAYTGADLTAVAQNLVSAAGSQGPYTWDGWNWFYIQVYGAGLMAKDGTNTQTAPMSVTDFLASAAIAQVQGPTSPVTGHPGMRGLGYSFPPPPLSKWTM